MLRSLSVTLPAVSIDLFSVIYGTTLASSHTDNISSFTVNLERISISLRRWKRSYIYEDVSRNKVQVRTGGHGLPVSTAIREADVPTVDTKSKRTRADETFPPKESEEFCFCAGASSVKRWELTPAIGSNCVGLLPEDGDRVQSPKRCSK
jgi:hypothetical protein